MALPGSGNATPEKREGRVRLSPRGPRIESLLGGIQFDGWNVEETRRFGNAMLAARDAWADKYRFGKRYPDAPADHHQNSLSWQKRGRA